MAHSCCIGLGQGSGNDGFLYYDMCHGEWGVCRFLHPGCIATVVKPFQAWLPMLHLPTIVYIMQMVAPWDHN